MLWRIRAVSICLQLKLFGWMHLSVLRERCSLCEGLKSKWSTRVWCIIRASLNMACPVWTNWRRTGAGRAEPAARGGATRAVLRLCMACCTNMRPVSINSLLSHACILSDDVIQALVLQDRTVARASDRTSTASARLPCMHTRFSIGAARWWRVVHEHMWYPVFVETGKA